MGKMVKILHVDMMELKNLYKGCFRGKRILITGHTGFKGSWLSLMLHMLEADVYGYALDPPTNPNLYKEAGIGELVTSFIYDIRNYEQLLEILLKVKPEIVFHLAAQPLVLESYRNPIDTYSTNVMGTVNLLEAIRQAKGVKAIVNVTTDKCYENREWHWGYRENEPMGGIDPYSNSKGCSELITASFRSSFFNPIEYKKHGVALASARAGNVIGGGDWAEDRLIPDFIRAINKGDDLFIRNPSSTRPWQHVLEPLNGYLLLASKLLEDGPRFAEGWNFGPDDCDVKNVEWITKQICSMWGGSVSYVVDKNPQLHEAKYLKLDCSKAKAELNWHPKWNIHQTLKSIVNWNKEWINQQNAKTICISQIIDFYNDEFNCN